MAGDEAVGYVYENVGFVAAVDPHEGAGYVYENVGASSETIESSVGVLITDGRNLRPAVAYVYENVGP